MPDTFARMRQLIGSTSEWQANDIVIGDGELAIERITGGALRMKIGNGVAKYSLLPYFQIVNIPPNVAPIVKTIVDADYTLLPEDYGTTVRMVSGDPHFVTFPKTMSADFQCIVFPAGDGLVSVVEEPGAEIENGYDRPGSLHRTIDRKGFGLHCWCDENLDGNSAHWWIQGVTRS